MMAVLITVAGGFFLWTATSGEDRLNLQLSHHDLYNRLVDGFLAGRLGFLEEPAPELAKLADPYDPALNAPYRRFHDIAYFQGRYYLYFGPAPALTLLAPWKAITGSYLPQHLGVAVFSWGAAMVALMTFLRLRRAYFPEASTSLVGFCAAAIVLGSMYPILLRRPVVYELAIASGSFFSLAGFYLMLRAYASERRETWWIAAASLSFGLAVASRPHFIFAGAGALGWYLWPEIRQWRLEPAGPWGARFCRGLSVLAPLAAVVVALLVYNFARFGSFLEFGTNFQLAGNNQKASGMTGLSFVGTNLWYYLLAPAQFSIYFPFIQVTPFLPFQSPAGYTGQENMYGLLATVPFLWVLLWFADRALRRAGFLPESLDRWVKAVAVYVLLTFAFLLTLSGANNRYFIDFVPLLTVLAAVAWLRLDAMVQGWGGRLVRAIAALAAVAAVVFTVFVSIQHHDLLRQTEPATYRKLAYAFNHLPHWLGGGRADRHGPIRIRLEFPKDRRAELEPILVSGIAFRADFVWIFYVDDRNVILGFEHTSYGGFKTGPIPVDYGVEHTVEIDFGALYPPVEHPYYDGWSEEQILERKRRVRISLNGRDVIAGEFDSYDSSPGDVVVGRNPVSTAFGRRFTGRVHSVERLPPAPRSGQ